LPGFVSFNSLFDGVVVPARMLGLSQATQSPLGNIVVMVTPPEQAAHTRQAFVASAHVSPVFKGDADRLAEERGASAQAVVGGVHWGQAMPR
jgi:hypothetical protein